MVRVLKNMWSKAEPDISILLFSKLDSTQYYRSITNDQKKISGNYVYLSTIKEEGAFELGLAGRIDNEEILKGV